MKKTKEEKRLDLIDRIYLNKLSLKKAEKEGNQALIKELKLIIKKDEKELNEKY